VTAHPASVPGWVCESCSPPAVDCPCTSWACNCWCQRARSDTADRMLHHADEALRYADRLVELAAVGPRICRCGGELSTVVGRDEDDGEAAEVLAVDECGVCGHERRGVPMGAAEVRRWVRQRKSLISQRMEQPCT
jgi:hypothetical protein